MEEKLGSIGGQMTLEALEQIKNNTIKFTAQDDGKATFTRKFSKEDGIITFEDDATEVVRKIKALAEQTGCTLKTNAFDLKIFKAEDVSGQFELSKGQVLENKKRFVIGFANGQVEIISCQSPSGKVVAGRDFLNGHNDILGKTLC